MADRLRHEENKLLTADYTEDTDFFTTKKRKTRRIFRHGFTRIFTDFRLLAGKIVEVVGV
jgi:hypothetical protein